MNREGKTERSDRERERERERGTGTAKGAMIKRRGIQKDRGIQGDRLGVMGRWV